MDGSCGWFLSVPDALLVRVHPGPETSAGRIRQHHTGQGKGLKGVTKVADPDRDPSHQTKNSSENIIFQSLSHRSFSYLFIEINYLCKRVYDFNA